MSNDANNPVTCNCGLADEPSEALHVDDHFEVSEIDGDEERLHAVGDQMTVRPIARTPSPTSSEASSLRAIESLAGEVVVH